MTTIREIAINTAKPREVYGNSCLQIGDAVIVLMRCSADLTVESARKGIEAALREFGEELAKNLDVRAKDCRVIAAGSKTHITRIMRHAAASEAELQALNIRAAIRESL